MEVTATCSVAAAKRAALTYVSKQFPLRLVLPTKPFQRATVTSTSIPLRSTCCPMGPSPDAPHVGHQ